MLRSMSTSKPRDGAPLEQAHPVGFCRQLCASEPLAGTATVAASGHGITRWVLLEDGGPWGAKTPKDSSLPQPVIEWLLARNAEPRTRVQLIRRPGSRCGSRRRLIVVEAPAQPSQRRMIEIEVELDDIPGLELEPLVRAAPAHPSLAELWLVCTHGTRDRCCAKWGMPVFEALRQRDPERVWQCSHLGGHRFAPTMLSLPDGLHWGRVELSRLDPLRDALRAGRLGELDQLRGRCSHSRPVQAAECLVRARDSIYADAALEFEDHEILRDGRERVRFRRAPEPGQLSAVIEVELERFEFDFAAPSSCGDEPEQRSGYRLV